MPAERDLDELPQPPDPPPSDNTQSPAVVPLGQPAPSPPETQTINYPVPLSATPDQPEQAAGWFARMTGAERRAQRDRWIETVRAPLGRPHVIVVAAGKGGVGTTTVALTLAERIAGLRSEQVAVVDAHRIGGTVGLRVAAQPGLGLPALLRDLTVVTADGSYTGWARYGTVEHRSRLTVFGRTDLTGEELTPDAYRTLLGGLLRLWPIVIVDAATTDTGTELAGEVMRSAQTLVVIASPGHASLAATAGWLRGVTIPRERRIGMLTPLSGGSTDELAALLRQECTQVVTMPNDPAIAGDAPVPMLTKTRRQTLDALTEAAAGTMRTREDRQT